MRAIGASLLIAGLLCSTPSLAAARQPPDIVLIMLDDARADLLSRETAPEIMRRLGRRGVTFSHAMVPVSLCCPSRTSTLTGMYSHTTGSYRGGIGSFDNDRRTLPVWLHRAGYRTGLFGKYLNGYGRGRFRRYLPPGWDRWVAFRRPGFSRTTGSIRMVGSTMARATPPDSWAARRDVSSATLLPAGRSSSTSRPMPSTRLQNPQLTTPEPSVTSGPGGLRPTTSNLPTNPRSSTGRGAQNSERRRIVSGSISMRRCARQIAPLRASCKPWPARVASTTPCSCSRVTTGSNGESIVCGPRAFRTMHRPTSP